MAGDDARPGPDPEQPPGCAWCGRQQADDWLTWTTSVEGGGLRWYCPDCSREHLRAIEGKLDAEFW